MDYMENYSLIEYQRDRHTHEKLKEAEIGKLYKESDVAHKVTQHFGNSLSYDFSSLVGTCQFCFIDGGHSRQHLESDTANAMKLLGERGVIVWHDYNIQHRDVRYYLKQLSKTVKLYHIEGTRLAVYFKPELVAPKSQDGGTDPRAASAPPGAPST